MLVSLTGVESLLRFSVLQAACSAACLFTSSVFPLWFCDFYFLLHESTQTCQFSCMSANTWMHTPKIVQTRSCTQVSKQQQQQHMARTHCQMPNLLPPHHHHHRPPGAAMKWSFLLSLLSSRLRSIHAGGWETVKTSAESRAQQGVQMQLNPSVLRGSFITDRGDENRGSHVIDGFSFRL